MKSNYSLTFLQNIYLIFLLSFESIFHNFSIKNTLLLTLRSCKGFAKKSRKSNHGTHSYGIRGIRNKMAKIKMKRSIVFNCFYNCHYPNETGRTLPYTIHTRTHSQVKIHKKCQKFQCCCWIQIILFTCKISIALKIFNRKSQSLIEHKFLWLVCSIRS